MDAEHAQRITSEGVTSQQIELVKKMACTGQLDNSAGRHVLSDICLLVWSFVHDDFCVLLVREMGAFFCTSAASLSP
jgi:hypothetical protein